MTQENLNAAIYIFLLKVKTMKTAKNKISFKNNVAYANSTAFHDNVDFNNQLSGGPATKNFEMVTL